MINFIFKHDHKGMLALTAQNEQEARQMLSMVLKTCFEQDCPDDWTLCREEDELDVSLHECLDNWWLTFLAGIPSG